MLKAEQRILLIGWDFDTRIHLSRGPRWWKKGQGKGHPRRLGSFIYWLARKRKGLEIRILKWGFGTFKFFSRGTMLLDLLRWWPQRRIDFKFDNVHPVGCSHHQKLVLIDSDFAVYGGIDLTSGRWDTSEHLPDDPRRNGPGREMHHPWHDMALMMEGEIAGALLDYGHHRWERASGKTLDRSEPRDGSAWPDDLEADFTDVEIGIARSRPPYNDEQEINEVPDLFVRQIMSARRFIYAESQYFASRAISEAIAERLSQPDPPEVVVVHSKSDDGWLESTPMDPARAELVKVLREIDKNERFHLYVPFSGDTPIYVHAKLLIVDDRVIRVGSANFNNRSMGLDTECDVFIDAEREGNAHASPVIRRLRHSLLAEHCELEKAEVGPLLERHGSMAVMISLLAEQGKGRLRPFHPPENGDLEKELAESEMLDPEDPEDLCAILPRRRGLFRSGSLLAKARSRLTRKRHAK